MFELGDTFYGGEEHHGKDHPWIVINDPSQHDGQALYVNITSIKGGRFDDLTCVLQRGEHVSVTHASFIRFDGAKSALITELGEAERLRLIVRGPKATDALVAKIRQAAVVAARFKDDFKKLL